MNLQNLRWPIVIVAMAVSLGTLFGGGYLVKSQTVEEPLKAVLQGGDSIDSFTVERLEERRVIIVRLKDTPDLERTYGSLDSAVRKVLKATPYKLSVEDRRNPELEEIYRRVNLFVHEALATGHFAAMADRVEQEAARGGARARLSVDGDRVYLQLHKEGAYLYSVMDRPKPAVVPAFRTTGGGLGL